MTDDLIYRLNYKINFPDFLEILTQQKHLVNDDYLAYVADILLRYKILDRPIITGDVSSLGRLALYALISKLNTRNLEGLYAKFKYHQHHMSIFKYLSDTQAQHDLDILTDRNDCGSMFRLNTICSPSVGVELPVVDHDDVKVYNDINDFFKIYQQNYNKAFQDNLISIPIFVHNETI